MKEQKLIDSVVAIIENEKGDILFLERHAHDRTNSGYCLPGGKVDVDKGEKRKAALKREVMEETGLNVLKAEKFVVFKNSKFKIHFYKAKCSGEVFINYSEHKSFLWYPIPPEGTLPLTNKAVLRYLHLKFPNT